MKFTHAFLISIFLLSSGLILAQETEKILIKFDDQEVTKDEFKRLYKKNNSTEVINKSTVDEYLDLFINFKLKVKEAQELGLDTIPSFIDELSGYRRQLAQPYLSAEGVMEKLKKEAYQRMQEEIRASHILIAIDENASPEDTLKAYKKAKKALQLLKEGSDFKRTAISYSDDNSAETTGGDLGYFTVFQMVYPFENAAYNTEKGEISNIVRSRFGYHILKITDRRKANGKVHAAHILISEDQQISNTAKPEDKIREIYKRLEEGESFEVLAKQFSDDTHSARAGGELPKFGVNQMVPEFEEVVFSLEEGAYSKPFQTQYGWHIAKLLEREKIQPYTVIQNSIEQNIKKDSRANLTKGAVLNKIKNQYGFKENNKALKDFYDVVGDSYLKAEWTVDAAKKLNKTIFSIGSKKVNQQDFAVYLNKHQVERKKVDTDVLVNKLYDNFVREQLLSYKDQQLENEEPEFKALVKEYHDGILLFNLTDDMVWSKAVEDTTALKEYYHKNKNKYRWEERLDATLYNAISDEVAQKAIKLINEGKSAVEIAAELNRNSQLNLKYEKKKYTKGDDPIVDQIKWTKGVSKKINKDERVYFVDVKEVMAPAPKTLNDARGLIISDYQNQLEDEWIKTLRNKYNFEINKSVLKELKKELN